MPALHATTENKLRERKEKQHRGGCLRYNRKVAGEKREAAQRRVEEATRRVQSFQQKSCWKKRSSTEVGASVTTQKLRERKEKRSSTEDGASLKHNRKKLQEGKELQRRGVKTHRGGVCWEF